MNTTTSRRAAAGSNIAWQLVERLDEHRGHPRLDMDCNVGFRNASGQHCVAKLLNMSPDGMQIRCNVGTAQVLHPAGGKICPQHAPIVQTEVALVLPRGQSMLSICAQLTYLTTLPEEPRCVMGLRFLEPRPTAQRVLDEFFAARMASFFDTGDELALSATG
jgi:hypothetical protein